MKKVMVQKHLGFDMDSQKYSTGENPEFVRNEIAFRTQQGAMDFYVSKIPI